MLIPSRIRRKSANGIPTSPPVYLDGVMELYDEQDRRIGDFPMPTLAKREIPPIGYRELAVYDDRRAMLQSAGREITLRVAIPRWQGDGAPTIRTHVKIGGMMHDVYNAANTVTKDGFAETELTLVRPINNLEVDDGPVKT